MLIRIVAKHFVAGIVLNERGHVERAAPIVRYMRYWDYTRVFDYCKTKKWIWERI